MPQNLTWQCQNFESLSNTTLYEILRMRQQIFIVEQNCPYVDADRKDFASMHVTGTANGVLCAYARIVPAGLTYAECSIGRVTTLLEKRNTGIGKILMQQTLNFINNLYGKVPIRIGAQSYLLKFYSAYGFKAVFAYEEDAIAHHVMLRPASAWQ
ncbi:MAG: GNAT family N-acetyltransferase [Bacteroidia bacterium]|nr:GNAT family N-acetyltransferase [Bacteroidia bacterium]